MNLIDTHAHLDVPDFDEDRALVIQRAHDSGVNRIVHIGATNGFDGAKRSFELSQKYEGIFCTLGIHPHDAALRLDIQKLRELAKKEKVVAVGETGLDFYRDWSPPNCQYQWFEAQIELAKELSLPLMIHSRAAAKECLEVLQRLEASQVGGVFHCYSEDIDFAHKLFDINFIVSITGAVTFKKAQPLRDLVEKLPANRFMVETDAPYLAPEPFRGKRCESSYVLQTARKIAEVRKCSLDEIAEITTKTAEQFYNLEAL